MSLSAKFAKLKNAAPTAGGNNGGNRVRVQQNISSQQNKRAAQNQARRTGAPVQSGNKGKAGGKPARGGKPIVSGVKRNLRNNGILFLFRRIQLLFFLLNFLLILFVTTGKKGKSLKKGGKKGEKKPKETPADLDKEMDKCKRCLSL